jgi:SAM-dependent methyltransferase
MRIREQIMHHKFNGTCTVCGGTEFRQHDVLWSGLINAWQLSIDETAYINRQQGFHCLRCKNNLRSQALAAAIVREYGFSGTLEEFCKIKSFIHVLEINRAGNLTPFLKSLPFHRLTEYPEFDMLDLKLESDSADLVIHSDTLEHIRTPDRALSECRRVLRDGGKCIFTVPIIVDRTSRLREGLPASFHGQPYVNASDQLVHTEFGADVWKVVISAGYSSCEIFSFEYPAALVLIAKK